MVEYLAHDVIVVGSSPDTSLSFVTFFPIFETSSFPREAVHVSCSSAPTADLLHGSVLRLLLRQLASVSDVRRVSELGFVFLTTRT